MPQLTPQQLELIEQIKQGTHAIEMPDNPTQDDVKLLNEVTGKYKPNANWRYYTLGRIGFDVNDYNLQVIPLSSFSQPQPKVVEVDKLIDFLDDFFESDKTKSHVTITLPESSYKQVRFGAEILKSQILNFLNEKGI